MPEWFNKIKREFDENPLQVMAVGAFIATAGAKVIDAMAGARSKRAYARQINRKGR